MTMLFTPLNSDEVKEMGAVVSVVTTDSPVEKTDGFL